MIFLRSYAAAKNILFTYPIKGLMKNFLSFVLLLLVKLVAYGQMPSAQTLFTINSLTASKFEGYVSKKNYYFATRDTQNDTLLSTYQYRGKHNKKVKDSVIRFITRSIVKEDIFTTYETTSLPEFLKLKEQLKNGGFYCNQEDRSDSLPTLLYQSKDLWARMNTRTADSIKRYSLMVYKKIFINEKDIHYANDLLTFTSHEYLVYYFGEKNVKKDIYYLSGNEIVNCSVLFLNTSRQVVFIWADEENRCTISSLLFGGQQNLKSSLESGKYVEENNWVLKSGVHPGMPLLELRNLHANDFGIYGGNSANSGLIIPDSQGKLDFKKEEIILGCLNCKDGKFSTAKVVNADEAILEGRILFVLSIKLNPL
jgi:hypothetical protein